MRRNRPSTRRFRTGSDHEFPYNTVMRKLEKLHAWNVAQDLAFLGYSLTLDPRLSKHFALIDQVRRASLSIPANIAEGYSLGTTPQFIRGLKIALGSNTELFSHLCVLRRLGLLEVNDVQEVLDLCSRSIAIIIGLIRTLVDRSKSRFPSSGRRLESS
jgi:four helix bundle protein